MTPSSGRVDKGKLARFQRTNGPTNGSTDGLSDVASYCCVSVTANRIPSAYREHAQVIETPSPSVDSGSNLSFPKFDYSERKKKNCNWLSKWDRESGIRYCLIDKIW